MTFAKKMLFNVYYYVLKLILKANSKYLLLKA